MPTPNSRSPYYCLIIGFQLYYFLYMGLEILFFKKKLKNAPLQQGGSLL